MPVAVIIGASADPAKYGNKSMRAHIAHGFEVYPVNPKGGEIEGREVYPSIIDVPIEHIDRVSMYVPPAVGLALLDDIATKGCGELWLNPGTESDELVTAAQAKGLNPIVGCSIIDVEGR